MLVEIHVGGLARVQTENKVGEQDGCRNEKRQIESGGYGFRNGTMVTGGERRLTFE